MTTAVMRRDWIQFRNTLGRIGFVRLIAAYCVLMGVFVPTRFDDPRASVVVFALIPLYLAGPLAVDAIAGERDRKTLESTLCTPVSPFHLMLGKLLLPVVLAMALTVCAMACYQGYSAIASRPSARPGDMLAALAFGLPLSLLCSAAGLHVSLTASSSRNAQQWYSITLLAVTVGLPLGLKALLPAIEPGTLQTLSRLFEGGPASTGGLLLFRILLLPGLALAGLAYRRFGRLWTMNEGPRL